MLFYNYFKVKHVVCYAVFSNDYIAAKKLRNICIHINRSLVYLETRHRATS